MEAVVVVALISVVLLVETLAVVALIGMDIISLVERVVVALIGIISLVETAWRLPISQREAQAREGDEQHDECRPEDGHVWPIPHDELRGGDK